MALEESRAAELLARDQYARGLSPVLNVFEAERRRRSAEERLMLSRQAVWNARIDLHLALGGDWEVSEAIADPPNATDATTQAERQRLRAEEDDDTT